VSGHYPDGTVPAHAHAFIAADQFAVILLAPLHAVYLSIYHGRSVPFS
jgi:hypothetical protein